MKILNVAAMLCISISSLACARHTKPLAAPAELSVPGRNFEAVWQASLDVLKDYYFRIDRQDRRAGVIDTLPMVGQYPLEFWRKDAVTKQAVAENALQTVFVASTVTIEADPQQPDTYRPVVRVELHRSNYPAAQITTSAEGYEMFAMVGGRNSWITDFGSSSGTTYYDDILTDRELSNSRQESTFPSPGNLTPLGRYEELEQRLTDAITKEASRRLAQ